MSKKQYSDKIKTQNDDQGFNIVVHNTDMNDERKYLNDIPNSEFKTDTDLEIEISYETLYKETVQFDIVNNHLRNILFVHKSCIINDCLNNNSKIQDKHNGIFMCHQHRIQFGNKLYQLCEENDCISDKLRHILASMSLSDATLIKTSNRYKSTPNYFGKCYAYLQYQLQIIKELLLNLERSDVDGNKNNNEKSNNNDEKDLLFDFLFLIFAYLEQVMELLILFYACFD